jgi:nucleotide-binding universal stress UspA family protein
MFEKLLVPVDFSGGSRSALNALKEIPGVREIILLHVVYNRYPSANPAIVHPRVQEARTALEGIKKGLVIPGATITTIVEEITGGEISEVINRTAIRLGISLVVMGRRGTGIIESLLLGSVASDTLRYGKTDLLLIPTPFIYREELPEPDIPRPALFSHVMVCTDFSEPEIGSICLEDLPWIRQASIFHSVTTGDSKDEIHSAVVAAESGLGKIRDAFILRGIPAQIHVSVGSASEEILAFSRQEGISLILIKSVGKKSFLHVLIGSTSAPVARNTQKPVLILKRSSAVKK